MKIRYNKQDNFTFFSFFSVLFSPLFEILFTSLHLQQHTTTRKRVLLLCQHWIPQGHLNRQFQNHISSIWATIYSTWHSYVDILLIKSIKVILRFILGSVQLSSWTALVFNLLYLCELWGRGRRHFHFSGNTIKVFCAIKTEDEHIN